MNSENIYESKFAALQLEYLYTVECNITFAVHVKSYEFSGSTHSCLHKEQVSKIVSTLNEMHRSLSGKCTISDYDSDSYITLEFSNSELKISGQIGSSFHENMMIFSFAADQTAVRLLAECLSGFSAV